MKTMIGAATFACALIAGHPSGATDFSLSDSAIMSLDYNMSNYWSPPPTANIVSRQDVPGVGVQYTIHFLSTTNRDYFCYQVSDKYFGAGTLVGIDVSAYSNFELKFTLLSVDGSSSGSQPFLVGALIGPWNGSYWAYRPELISLAGNYAPSVVSTVSVTAATIGDVGFTAQVYPYEGGWSVGLHDVTLLVQAAPGVVMIPEPATWAMAAMGAVALLAVPRLRRRSS